MGKAGAGHTGAAMRRILTPNIRGCRCFGCR